MEAARVNRPDYRQSLAQAIARGVIRFVNVMGDRHLQLPGLSPDRGAPAPISLAPPPVPSGLAHDPVNGNVKRGVSSSVAPATSATAPTAPVSIHKSNKDKSKKPVVATPELSHPPEPAPAPSTAPSASTTPASSSTTKSEANGKSPASTSGGALNLSEPKAPAPSPGAEKAPPEPDEPPTVNIYPTDSPAPTNSAPATNANPSPAPSSKPQ
jgi:hypothetical protein